MIPFSEVQGQNRVVDLLSRAVTAGRVAQAYLFCGPRGCGKYTTGLALAMALNCDFGTGCNEQRACLSCSKIAAGIHPDVRTLATQGAKAVIPIATIRKEVIPVLAMPPHEGKARIFLVEEATSMLGPAANALLKTLEEPPRRTHFILCSVSPNKLLPTIRSRCQRINFQQLSAEQQARVRGDEEEAAQISALAEDIVQVSNARGLHPILDLAKGSTDKAILLAALQEFARHCHTEARTAAQGAQLESAQRYGRRARAVLATIQAIVEHNAHIQLALESLLVRLRSIPVK